MNTISSGNMKVSQSDSLRQENIAKTLATNVIKNTKVMSGLGLKTVNIGDATLVSPSLANYSLNKENSLSLLNQLRDFGLQKTSFTDKACSVVFNAANKLNTNDAVGDDDFFDISHISPQGVDLLTAAIILSNALYRSEIELSSNLSVISFEHALTAADKIKEEGADALWGAIGQAGMALGATGAGTVMQVGSSVKERGVYSEAKKTATPETPSVTPTVAPASATSTGSVSGETMPTSVQGGQNADLRATETTNVTANSEQKQSAAEQSAEEQPSQVSSEDHKTQTNVTKGQENELVLSSEQQKRLKSAQSLNLIGNFVSQIGTFGGTVAMQVGQMNVRMDQASSQIEQAQSQATNVAADNLRNVSSSVLNLIQEMLKTMDSLCQSKLSNMTVFSSHI
ncbi:IpaC/SipC family type III secretion system effector [Escherichia coli]